jgi:hypothetical protein
METSQIHIMVDREVLRNFRAECVRRGTTPTKEVARLMAQRLEEWLQRPPGVTRGGDHAQQG